MSNFTSNVSDLVSKEFKMTILVKEMDICQLKMYIKQIEEEKLRREYGSPRGLGLMVGDILTKGVKATKTSKVGISKEAKGLLTLLHPNPPSAKG